MQAKYTTDDAVIVLNMTGDDPRKREFKAKATRLPDGFQEALQAVTNESSANAIPDEEEPLRLFLARYRRRGLCLFEARGKQLR